MSIQREIFVVQSSFDSLNKDMALALKGEIGQLDLIPFQAKAGSQPFAIQLGNRFAIWETDQPNRMPIDQVSRIIQEYAEI